MDYIIDEKRISKLIQGVISSIAGNQLKPSFTWKPRILWMNENDQMVIFSHSDTGNLMINLTAYKMVEKMAKELFPVEGIVDKRIVLRAFNEWFNKSQDMVKMDPKTTSKSLIDIPFNYTK